VTPEEKPYLACGEFNCAGYWGAVLGQLELQGLLEQDVH
jgi:hypothetical protein